MSKIIQGNYKILFNRQVGPDYFEMAICAPRIAQKAKPGQFVHLRCLDSPEPFLRRPFSFHRLNQENFAILYKVIGRGTSLLAKKQKGDTVDILGPLGNGFNLIRTTQNAQRTTIIVAGGMGVAPLLALAERLNTGGRGRDAGRRRSNILVLLGARNRKQILCAREFQKLGARVQIATDDGTRGYQGPVTDLLKKVLRNTQYAIRTTIYACGPKPMLQEISRISQRWRLVCYASLEENMACGIGACLGCAVKTRQGYKQVCKDGPVFNLKEIIW